MRTFSAISLLSAVFRTGGIWLIATLLAIQNRTDDLASFVLGMAITTPVFVLASLGLRNIYVSRLGAVDWRLIRRLRSEAIAVASILSLVLSLLLSANAPVVTALCLKKLFDYGLDLGAARQQVAADTRGYAKNQIAYATASTGTALIVLVANRSLIEILLAYALAGGLVNLVLSHSTEVPSSSATDLQTRRQLLRLGIPAGTAQFLSSLLLSLPVFALSRVEDPIVVSTYGLLAYFLSGVSMAAGAIQQATLRPLALRRASSMNLPNPSNRTAAQGLALGIACALGFGFYAYTMPLIYGPSYFVSAEAFGAMAIHVIVLPIQYIGGAWLTARNQFTRQTLICAAAIVGSIATLFVSILTPFGSSLAMAAALLAIGSFIRSGLTYVTVWHYNDKGTK